MSSQHQAYFSDRCPRTVFGNETARPCSLKLGHEGECLPVPWPRQTVSNQHSHLLSNLGATTSTYEPRPRLSAPCQNCGSTQALHYLWKGEPFLVCAVCFGRHARGDSA